MSLQLVALCKGRGADVKSYKPDKDESQWWSRRDALVRCVASALFSSGGKGIGKDISLVLIFDEDWSRFEMAYDHDESDSWNTKSTQNTSLIPTESAIVSLWKESASKPNQMIHCDGLSCRLLLSPIPSDQMAATDSSGENTGITKREVLDYLQANCSIEFLRQQGLNASASVLLRKTNLKKLLGIWKLWKTETFDNEPFRSESSPLAKIFQSLLQRNSNNNSVIAGILHESSHSELPCFTNDFVSTPCPENLRVCLFLGAVRDMYPEENQLLRCCCESQHVPLVNIRLGPVSEFTSKIIAVAVYHHVNDRLATAMWKLHADQNSCRGNGSEVNHITAKSTTLVKALHPTATSLPTSELHVVFSLALNPSQIHGEINNQPRAPVLWTLVRVIVSTLWRSRLAGLSTEKTSLASASFSSSSPLLNMLTIIFQDQSSLTLCQDDLVKRMADQHHAAPSEYQIIQEVHDKLTKELVPIRKRISTMRRLYSACLDLTRRDWTEDKLELNLMDCCYKSQQDSSSSGKLMLLLGDHDMTKILATKLRRKAGIDPIPARLIPPNAIDYEAASIVMTQHLMYQYRLLPLLSASLKTEGDRKRPRIK